MRLAQVAVPLCVTVAVLRHRLLEIDLIVNRALVRSGPTSGGPRARSDPRARELVSAFLLLTLYRRAPIHNTEAEMR